MAISKDRVKELLGTGLGPEVVASAVGCDISYISQLLADENFASEVSGLRTIALTQHTRRDATINGIEDKLLAQLDEMVSERAFYKPRDVLSAMAIVNKAVRRGAAPVQSGTTINNVIHLSLPSAVVRKFATNRNGEVVEVEGQTLVTMPAHQLLKELASKGGDNAAQYQESLRYLPSGIETTIVSVPKRESNI
jgi:hypothetical protein